MLPIYKYNNVYTLIQDLENSEKIYCKYGKVTTITLNDSDKEKEGYVQIYIENFNRVYRESTRYSFTFSEFLKILFSKLVFGLYYYIYVENLGTYWDFSALTDLQQLSYNQLAYELYLKELKVFFPASIPLAPKVMNVIITPGDGQLTITWDAIPGATSYILYYSNVLPITIYSNRVEDIRTNSYVLDNLENNNEYFLRIAVMEPNYPTNNPLSDQVSGVPQLLPLITPILSISNLLLDNTLSWLPIEQDFFSITGDKYQIYWNTTGGVTTSDNLIDDILSNAYIHSGLTSGTTYYYVVRQINLRGQSSLSNEVSFTIL
jgi:hypothetical protein